MSKKDRILIGTPGYIYGMVSKDGLAKDTINMQGVLNNTPSFYSIKFSSIHNWQLSIYDKVKDDYIPVLHKDYLVFKNPAPEINRIRFYEIINNCFSPCLNANELWDIVDNAKRQSHGTMILVSNEAHDEAIRLSKCSIAIEQTTISKSIRNLSSIDGALICDPYGNCYAIGAILDGKHEENNGEDISQGARHNSARRYLYYRKEQNPAFKGVIIVVSETGKVTILPE